MSDGKKEAIQAVDKAVDDFWDSFEDNQKLCQHKTLLFGAGAYYLICNECQQYWSATTKMSGTDPDFAETKKDMTGREVNPL